MRKAQRKLNRSDLLYFMEIYTNTHLHKCIWATGDVRQVREALKRSHVRPHMDGITEANPF